MFTANSRNEEDMDVFLVNPLTEERPRLLVERRGIWFTLSASKGGRRVLLREFRGSMESSIHMLDVETGDVEPLEQADRGGVYRDARLTSDGSKAYVISNRGGEVLRLWEVELASRSWRPISPDVPWDVEHLTLAADGRRLAFTINEDGRSRVHVHALERRETTEVRAIPEGVVSSLMFSPDGEVLAMSLDLGTAPMDAYTFDLRRSALVRWTESEVGGLDPSRFVAPELVHFESFDGLSVPAWYFRPRGSGPFPVLLWIHGGPEDQFRPGFNAVIQYFAVELGVAVIAPNIRGSEGYGREYLSLDDGPRREDSIRDIGALLDWIEAQQELDAARVGIYGASYGGYVVLASLIHFGDRLAAGCDQVGVSSFVTFLENTSPYRREFRRLEYGDERDETTREHLQRISPLASAHRIRSPLFVAHGAHDPRVPVSEAAQIVEAVRGNGQEVWFAVARGEGHSFQRASNRAAFHELMVSFFAEHLGVDPGRSRE